MLNVTGSVTLDSGAQLDITTILGFDPANGTTFNILDYTGTEGGTFTITDPLFNGGTQQWVIASTGPDDIVLEAEAVITGATPVTATWAPPSPSGVTGNWTTANEWSCAPGAPTCVPNNTASDVYTAVLDSAGNTLTLDNSMGAITINNLTLTAGTLDIASGASLNVLNNGLTDINANSGLILAGTFTNGSQSGLAGLTTVEGTLTLANGQTTSVTPGGVPPTLTNSGTINVQQSSTLAITGALTNSGAINTGSDGSGSNKITISDLLTNSGSISLNGTGDSLSADLNNTGSIGLTGDNETLTDGGAFNNSGSLGMTGTMDTLSVTGNFRNTAGGVGAPIPSIGAGGASLSLSGDTDSVTVGGTFTNDAGATVAMSGTNDSIAVTGTLTNNGTINLTGSEQLVERRLDELGGDQPERQRRFADRHGRFQQQQRRLPQPDRQP